jgi:hypothetical protein
MAKLYGAFSQGALALMQNLSSDMPPDITPEVPVCPLQPALQQPQPLPFYAFLLAHGCWFIHNMAYQHLGFGPGRPMKKTPPFLLKTLKPVFCILTSKGLLM